MKKTWFGLTVITALFAVSGNAQTQRAQQDLWLTYGLAGYEALRRVESDSGQSALNERLMEMSALALAYDKVSLVRAHELSPSAFNVLITNKGGMVIWMLEGIIGRDNLEKTIRDFRAKNGSVTVSDFCAIAEKYYGEGNLLQPSLEWFFDQWMNSTGAPAFRNEYIVARNSKGFIVRGKISNDLDLFRMPLEIRIETEGNPETKTIGVSGASTQYEIQTFGRPKPGGITIDPANRVLKNSPELKVRAAILRGEFLFQKGDFTGAVAEYQGALEMNKSSSLAHYREGEAFFAQKNTQMAANEFRAAMEGDLNPKWTEVWSHIYLGKIFDIGGQRERSVNEYSQALQTKDDTNGAQAEAGKYLEAPYKEPAAN